jgi:hypothetical protein
MRPAQDHRPERWRHRFHRLIEAALLDRVRLARPCMMEIRPP